MILGFISIERFFMYICSYTVKHIFNGVNVRSLCWYIWFLAPTFYMDLFTFLLFCDGSPSWRKSFAFGLLLFSKASLKCLCMKSTNISPLIFPKYCSHKITYLLNAILPPLPLWLPLVVQSVSKHSLRCHQVMLLTDLTSSKGLYLFW